MAIYPTAISRAFAYSPADGYWVADPIPNGIGYWLKFSGPGYVPIPGHARTSDSVAISPGWNLIGSLSDPIAAASVLEVPGGILTSPFFSYRGSYFLDDTLRPHEGYFVKANGSGKIYLNSGPVAFAGAAGAHDIGSLKHDLGEGASSITLKDSRGRIQVLYFGFARVLSDNRGSFELPPIPPEEAFDARFSDGTLAWMPRADDPSARALIEIRSNAYPLEISWHLAAGEGGYALSEGGSPRRVDLSPVGHLTLKDPGTSVLRLTSSGQGNLHALPKEYGLSQNYPNPFNPTTFIAYQLPADGHVTLEIYNLIGQRVRLLIDEAGRAGTYTAEWDGKSAGGVDAAGGIYLVKLTVSSGGKQVFTSTKKTVLMR
jgi:hypothetical protein